jgi:hypothetical protein
MRKFMFGFIFLLLSLTALTWIAWEGKASVASYLLERQLKIPVTIERLEITKSKADINNLWIGNPLRSLTKTSFSAGKIDIDAQMKQIFDNPLILDQIVISNIFVGVEYYEDGSTNWDKILSGDKAPAKEEKDYLIRSLILENLTVEVVQANGQKKRYPTIPRMEFHNISADSGVPISEIEKAIFKLMMKDIFDKFNLFQQQLPIPTNSPAKYIPKLFN